MNKAMEYLKSDSFKALLRNKVVQITAAVVLVFGLGMCSGIQVSRAAEAKQYVLALGFPTGEVLWRRTAPGEQTIKLFNSLKECEEQIKKDEANFQGFERGVDYELKCFDVEEVQKYLPKTE